MNSTYNLWSAHKSDFLCHHLNFQIFQKRKKHIIIFEVAESIRHVCFRVQINISSSDNRLLDKTTNLIDLIEKYFIWNFQLFWNWKIFMCFFSLFKIFIIKIQNFMWFLWDSKFWIFYCVFFLIFIMCFCLMC